VTQSKQLEKISKELFGDKWIIPLAEYLGITRQAVYLWIADKRKIPKVVFMALTMKKQLDKIPDRWKKAIG
jgi:plasmid maintenance system antidote protein VapI|tara:strand:+ start:331 stop:543 length:213 start_codon:yes stop_codon:yes gene_type:complete